MRFWPVQSRLSENTQLCGRAQAPNGKGFFGAVIDHYGVDLKFKQSCMAITSQ